MGLAVESVHCSIVCVDVLLKHDKWVIRVISTLLYPRWIWFELPQHLYFHVRVEMEQCCGITEIKTISKMLLVLKLELPKFQLWIACMWTFNHRWYFAVIHQTDYTYSYFLGYRQLVDDETWWAGNIWYLIETCEYYYIDEISHSNHK